MLKFTTLLLLLVSAVAGAQSLPNYYPQNGFARTAVIDAVMLDESKIIIGDIDYRMNARPIVRSPSSAYDSMRKIRPGVRVAFRLDGNAEIVEFWIVPDDYEDRRRARGGR